MPKESFCQVLVFFVNFGSSFVAYLVHIATFQNKQGSHYLVVPVAASVQIAVIDLVNLTGLVNFIVLNYCSYN